MSKVPPSFASFSQCVSTARSVRASALPPTSSPLCRDYQDMSCYSRYLLCRITWLSHDFVYQNNIILGHQVMNGYSFPQKSKFMLHTLITGAWWKLPNHVTVTWPSLQELLKHTPIDHPDNYCVADGIEKLHGEMIRLNQSIKSCQLACSVRRVQSRKSFRFAKGVRRSTSRISAITPLKR